MMGPQGQMMGPQGQMMGPPQGPGYAGWAGQPHPGSAAADPRHGSVPPMMSPGRLRKQALKPWMLVVGALVMAALAFAITRAFLS
jgi:hypothetical protein